LLSIEQILDPQIRHTKTLKIDLDETEKYYICRGKGNIPKTISFTIVLINDILIFTSSYFTNEIKPVASNFYESIHITYALYCKNNNFLKKL